MSCVLLCLSDKATSRVFSRFLDSRNLVEFIIFFFGSLFHLYNLFFLVSLSLNCPWTGAKEIYKIRLARFLLFVDCISVDVREFVCIICSMKRGHPPIPFDSLPSLWFPRTFTETRKIIINMKIIGLKRKEGGFWRVCMITYCDQSLAIGHAPICSNPFRHLRRRRHFHYQHHQDHQG